MFVSLCNASFALSDADFANRGNWDLPRVCRERPSHAQRVSSRAHSVVGESMQACARPTTPCRRRGGPAGCRRRPQRTQGGGSFFRFPGPVLSPHCPPPARLSGPTSARIAACIATSDISYDIQTSHSCNPYRTQALKAAVLVSAAPLFASLPASAAGGKRAVATLIPTKAGSAHSTRQQPIWFMFTAEAWVSARHVPPRRFQMCPECGQM